MPGCVVSATTASFRSIGNPRLRATPVITSTFENVSDIGVCLGLSLGPPAIAGVRSKQGALQTQINDPKVIAAKAKQKKQAAAAECEKRGGIKIGMTREQVYAS